MEHVFGPSINCSEGNMTLAKVHMKLYCSCKIASAKE